jgi:hypothetical protein
VAFDHNNPLPGVPLVESPFFARWFSPELVGEETYRIAKDIHEQGYAVIDFPDPDFDALSERLKQKLVGRYDLDAFRQGKIQGLRIQDVWHENEESYRIATNPAVLSLLETLYGRKSFPFQSLNFPVGTQQHYHSDSLHFSSMPERFMCGVWVALEDIDEDQGPLIYFPGSHKWPIYTGEHIGHTYMSDFGTYQARYEGVWTQLVEAAGLPAKRFSAKKGQALIWAANLLHGGDIHRDKSKTRWSQVTHYFFKDCAYYTPMHTDLALGIVSFREPYNILTRGTEKNFYNSIPIPDDVVLAASPAHDRHSWARKMPTDFDPETYLELNPDVRAAKVDPYRHFLVHGIGERRRYRR